jgi:hypothetical protein
MFIKLIKNVKTKVRKYACSFKSIIVTLTINYNNETFLQPCTNLSGRRFSRSRNLPLREVGIFPRELSIRLTYETSRDPRELLLEKFKSSILFL